MRKSLLLLGWLISCSSTDSTSVSGSVGTGGGTTGGGAGVSRTAASSVQLDPQERRALEQTSPRTLQRMDRGEPLTLNDVIKLSQGGVRDDITLQYLYESNSTYQLSPAQLRRLRDAGVSEPVVDAMVNSGQPIP